MGETDDMALRVLRMFREWGRETLDLHELFEAGDSNDPDARREVFFAVAYRKARGGDGEQNREP